MLSTAWCILQARFLNLEGKADTWHLQRHYLEHSVNLKIQQQYYNKNIFKLFQKMFMHGQNYYFFLNLDVQQVAGNS